MTTPNLQALYEAIWDIEDNPEGWDQTTYGKQTACGTFGCLAYRVCERDGKEFDVDSDGELTVWTPDGYRTICASAINILGITMTEAFHLFHANTGIQDFYDYADALAKYYNLPIPQRPTKTSIDLDSHSGTVEP
jgi:hypothetical protein